MTAVDRRSPTNLVELEIFACVDKLRRVAGLLRDA